MFPTCDRSDRKLRRTIPPILRGSISPKRDESYQLSRRRGRYDGRTYLRKSLREFEGRLLELENQGKVESQMKRLKPFWNQGYFQCGVVWDRPGFATLIGNDNTNHTVDDANDADDDDGWYGTDNDTTMSNGRPSHVGRCGRQVWQKNLEFIIVRCCKIPHPGFVRERISANIPLRKSNVG